MLKKNLFKKKMEIKAPRGAWVLSVVSVCAIQQRAVPFFAPLSETEVNYFNYKSLIGRRSRSSDAARIRKRKESCLKLPVAVTQSLVAQIAGETEEKKGANSHLAAEGEARVIGANSDPYRRCVSPAGV